MAGVLGVSYIYLMITLRWKIEYEPFIELWNKFTGPMSQSIDHMNF